MADSLVEPTAPQAQQTPPVEPTGTAEAQPEPTLPASLMKIPAMQALIVGTPPALSFNIKKGEKHEYAPIIRKNKNNLAKAGIGFYRALSGDTGVMFNMLHIHPADIQAADKAGKLRLIAPDFGVVDHMISKAGLQHPALHATSVPGGFAAPQAMSAPPQQAQGIAQAPPQAAAPPPMGFPKLPAGTQRKLTTARLQAMAPGAPTSGPAPGAGRLLNSILKPVI